MDRTVRYHATMQIFEAITTSSAVYMWMRRDTYVTQISASAMQTVLNVKCCVMGRPLIHYVKLWLKGTFLR